MSILQCCQLKICYTVIFSDAVMYSKFVITISDIKETQDSLHLFLVKISMKKCKIKNKLSSEIALLFQILSCPDINNKGKIIVLH